MKSDKERIEEIERNLEDLSTKLLPRYRHEWERHMDREELLNRLQDMVGKVRIVVNQALQCNDRDFHEHCFQCAFSWEELWKILEETE